MKFQMSMLAALFLTLPAFANQQVTDNGPVADLLVRALHAAGLEPIGGTEDTATYHAWNIECQGPRDPDVGNSYVSANCSIYLGPSEHAPSWTVGKDKAAAVLDALALSGAEADAGMHHYRYDLLNFDATVGTDSRAAHATF